MSIFDKWQRVGWNETWHYVFQAQSWLPVGPHESLAARDTEGSASRAHSPETLTKPLMERSRL